ncbi:putative mediator of RNA polymerase II transcription subunit 19 [Elsinoe australis]|uniref:Mediator of RNA polymerase II transcription subunit 19 n=1 Tax=Elsinoe australis TaxID=40998 RepID=A0A4U7AYW1_9PEZI|nr:putative mediator of RNA polymerase II transcription subunit 19 [Elsinoe australis]
MASSERSPKRQRLSPPGDNAPQFASNSGADSAYGSTTASQVNGTASHKVESTISIPGLSISGPSSTAEAPGGAKSEGADMKAENSDHRRTDHERQDAPPSATENLPLLCRKSHPRSRPHPTQDLISLYNLSPLAATVARRDPNTGAKINKLRKSYEGKVKKQELPGRNKPTHIEGELMGFMEWPDEGWYDQRVYGRELEVALDPVKGRLWREDGENPGGKGKVERAVTLAVGRLPREEDEKWRAALALDEPVAAKAPQQAHPNGMLKPGLLNTGLRASAPASPMGNRSAVDRPDRAGKKRRYDDTSFEGYDGGWSEEGGYLSGDSRGKQGKRRRDFDHSGSTPQSAGPSDNHGHFNSSSGSKIVGVRSS